MSNFPEVACWVANELKRLGLSPFDPGPPNFSAITINEDTPKALADLAELIKYHPVLSAQVFFNDDPPKGYVRATRGIGAYATDLGAAIECRLKGEVDRAKIYEGSAERIYSKLPKFARW